MPENFTKVNIGSGGGLAPSCNKPLPGPMLTQFYVTIWHHSPQWVNSSPPICAYMHQWTGPALVQVMACHLFGDKPLPEPMLSYCQLDSWEQISLNLKLEFYNFHSRKCIWNCRLPKWWPFCPQWWEGTRIVDPPMTTRWHTPFCIQF